MSVALPLIATAVSAYGAYSQGQAAKKAGELNAQTRAFEGQAAEQQSLTQEATQRREGRQFLGRQAAAIGQAGIGYGGSSAGVMNQSAINAELDALNVRYKGAFTKYGYTQESQFTKDEGDTAYQNAKLRAGATLLKGYANYGTDLS